MDAPYFTDVLIYVLSALIKKVLTEIPNKILCWRVKVCYLVFVVPCEGSKAEALKYMRGVNLAWVARASLSEENRFGPAAASLALPAWPECGVEWGQPELTEPESEPSAKSGLGLLSSQLSSGSDELEPALISWLPLAMALHPALHTPLANLHHSSLLALASI